MKSPLMEKILRLVGKAMGDYHMIDDKDRVLSLVSGRKDGVFLLEVLRHFQRIAPIDFEIYPVFVDIGLPDFPSAQSQLKDYLGATGLSCEILKAPAFNGESWDHIECSGFSEEWRHLLAEAAGRLKCTKVALGHNLNDMAQAILYDLFFRGQIGVVHPDMKICGKTLPVIFPLVYVQADDIAQAIAQGGIPSLGGSGCSDDEFRRVKIREALGQMEKVTPHAPKNVIKSLRNIRTEYLP